MQSNRKKTCKKSKIMLKVMQRKGNEKKAM
jgi:hypothetical protein